ncbi:molybdenum cofactor guanylyltransferase [Clostridium taeniosporum]|uniref:Probable molybdenum cofactor guanylyltransferase n=1 Tax=Clostridium taeniosporum TaxID=394958 RepID=A0A1D7XN34_9CLOT|nr:molybdenum cofactor guanylyltransferase [Clostridium taeniosporum]AOR24763.1 molybdenum cofactor guanylyltransferase [Clostridium taeniosporum]
MKKFKTAVILAGGKSSRMGFDKQFLKINEKRLINVLIDTLKKEFEEIIIVTNKKNEYKDFLCKIVCDEIKEKGPLSGIHVGLKESSSKYVYFIACDMPNINLNYIKFMKEKIENLNIDACITKINNNIQPFNGFYSKNIIKYIEEIVFTDKKSLFYLVNNVKTLYIQEHEARRYDKNLNMFINLNNYEDLNNFNSGGISIK